MDNETINSDQQQALLAQLQQINILIPPMFTKALKYQYSAQYLACYRLQGNISIYHDGYISGMVEYGALDIFLRHPYVRACLGQMGIQSHQLYGEEEPATHCLVIDTVNGLLYAGPMHVARAIITQQWPTRIQSEPWVVTQAELDTLAAKAIEKIEQSRQEAWEASYWLNLWMGEHYPGDPPREDWSDLVPIQ